MLAFDELASPWSSGAQLDPRRDAWTSAATLCLVPFFPYAIDRRWAPLFQLLRVKETDGVQVSDGMMRATFGRVSVATPIDNIDHTEVTGPHRWYTAVGLRLSLRDSSITFGTNHQRGLWIAFVEGVPKVIGVRDHCALWVSVADPDGLAAALDR